MNKPLLLLALLGTTATAAVSFTHGDWQINCDNTHTCRVAGYQTDDGEKAPVSVLLTRAAGADAPISGKISLLTDDESPLPDHITFTLDGKNLGELRPDKNNGEAELSTAQIEALLTALQAPHADIQFSGGKTQWQLSAAGASAVLLKWDEAQGRLQTASAVTLKQRGKKAVTVAPAAKPELKAVNIQPGKPTLIAPDAADYARLNKLLDPKAECLTSDSSADQEFYSAEEKSLAVYELDARHKLVAKLCWRGPYNTTHNYGLFDNKLQNLQQRLGSDEEPMNDFDGKTISGQMKGRGLGDCWSGSEYIWTGEKYELSSALDSGLCRGFGGGAWQLPTFVSNVTEVENAQ